jgi:hypothetical protein
MHILLKDLLKEEEEKSALQVQLYVYMDGVLVDMEAGFKELSDGLAPREYEEKNGKSSFWKLISSKPNFWIDLKPMPDAKILWDFIKENFKNPPPVILSAGQGSSIVQQKTAWIRKHIDPTVKVIIASAGSKKPEYILKTPGRVTHVLLDDTQKNIDVWDNVALHRIAIHHTDSASSIKKLQTFINE